MNHSSSPYFGGVCLDPNLHYRIEHIDLLIVRNLPMEATPFFLDFAQNKKKDSYQLLMEAVNYYQSLNEKDRTLFAVYTAYNRSIERWQYGFLYNPYDDIQQDYNYLKGHFLNEKDAAQAGLKFWLSLYDTLYFEKPLPFVDFIKKSIFGEQLSFNFK